MHPSPKWAPQWSLPQNIENRAIQHNRDIILIWQYFPITQEVGQKSTMRLGMILGFLPIATGIAKPLHFSA